MGGPNPGIRITELVATMQPHPSLQKGNIPLFRRGNGFVHRCTLHMTTSPLVRGIMVRVRVRVRDRAWGELRHTLVE